MHNSYVHCVIFTVIALLAGCLGDTNTAESDLAERQNGAGPGGLLGAGLPVPSVPGAGGESSDGIDGGASAACLSTGSYDGCASCECEADRESCLVYAHVINTEVYCGQTCEPSCEDFCASLEPGNAKPADASLVTPACVTCVSGIPEGGSDFRNLDEACKQSAPCIFFALKLQQCASLMP